VTKAAPPASTINKPNPAAINLLREPIYQ
jgi:hypothetical protein